MYCGFGELGEFQGFYGDIGHVCFSRLVNVVGVWVVVGVSSYR